MRFVDWNVFKIKKIYTFWLQSVRDCRKLRVKILRNFGKLDFSKFSEETKMNLHMKTK
jgi:hypothetical protein